MPSAALILARHPAMVAVGPRRRARGVRVVGDTGIDPSLAVSLAIVLEGVVEGAAAYLLVRGAGKSKQMAWGAALLVPVGIGIVRRALFPPAAPVVVT